jgi:hypothetical protein
MKRRHLERALWCGAVASAGAGLIELHAGSVSAAEVTSAAPLPAVVSVAALPTSDSLESAVGDIADRNLFRPERASADESAVTAESVPVAMAPPSAKPHLVLRGVLGGPPWDAVIEGVPGREGAAVIRVGEPTAGLTVRRVQRDTAWVRGFDTTWTLPLTRSFQ